MDVIWITDGKNILLYRSVLFFYTYLLEGCVEKDPEGSLRKRGIISKQHLLKESKKEAVPCLPSICHPILGKTTHTIRGTELLGKILN